MKIFRTILLLTFLITGFVLPGTVTTVGSGNWSSTTPGAPWPGGTLPLSGDDVIIADGSTVTINQAVTVASLTIGQGTSGILTFDGVAIRAVVVSGNITVNTGAQFVAQASGAFVNTLSIGGDLTNNGTFDMSLGTTTAVCNITFTLAGTQNIKTTATPTLTRLNKFTLAKSALANEVKCSINVIYGAAPTFTAGTWEQTSGTLTYNATGSHSIAAAGGMIFSGNSNFSCSFTGGTSGSFVNSGILTVNTSGTFTIGNTVNANTALTSISNISSGGFIGATFTQGNITIYGKMSLNSGTTNIYGANIYLIPNGSSFSVANNGTAGSTFGGMTSGTLNFTSGTVTFVNPNVNPTTRTGRDIYIAGGTINLTGSTFIFGDGSTKNSGTGFLINTNTPLYNLTIQTGNNSTANGRDVILASSCTVNGTLSLSSGHITTTSNLLTLGSSAIVSGGGAGSYIDGPLSWTVAASGYVVFPIGKIIPSDAYRPVSLNVTQGAGTNVYAAEQKEGADPSASTLAGTLDSKSSVRYLNITQTGSATVTAADLIISYGTDDGVASNNAALRIAHDNGSVFVDLGGIGNAPTTGTITSVVNFTTFGDFILAFNTGRVLALTSLIEGFYNGVSMVPDTVTVELHNTGSPFTLVDSKKGVLNYSGIGNFSFTSSLNGTAYYIVIKHRNAVETWSAAGNTFSASALSYDFTSAVTQAFGSNQILKGSKYCVYSGDVNQDGIVDSGDLGTVDNDNSNFVSGYTNTDVNGDGIVDSGDLGLVDNNNSNFVGKITPTGSTSVNRVYKSLKTNK